MDSWVPKMIKLVKNEKGFSLLEVLVALGLMGVIAVAFLAGIASSSRAVLVADEKTTAESLARSQMEYVKEISYVDGAATYDTDPELVADMPEGFGVSTSAQPLNSPDDGIQKIMVTISYNSEPVTTLEDYKVDR
jgi:prepilin-type N-terminal cleavage/methylation domain-containing protein